MCQVLTGFGTASQHLSMTGNPGCVIAIQKAADYAYHVGPTFWLGLGRISMVDKLLPRHLRKAVERLKADPARAWTVGEIAACSGVAPRTLQRLFRRFLGCLPMRFLRDLRLDRARSEALCATAGK